jgi:signal transduction histidine kinase
VPAAALGYVLLQSQPTATAGIQGMSGTVIGRTVLVAVAAAFVLTWAAIVAQDLLPTLVISGSTFSSTASALTVFPLVLGVLAAVVLWPRRRSHLDEWLLVALIASVAETMLVVFIGASRYTFPFYASRPLAVVTSCAVLVALLSEMMRLYVRLSMAVNALERERANKLMNLDVVVRSIAHEIKQPLMVITTCAAVIKTLMGKPKVDVDEVQVNLDDVTSASLRIGESIDSLRGLFKNPQEAQQPIDVNELALASLKTFHAELSDHGIAVITELAEQLPLVVGHEGQLRAVVVNIVQNAIDELAPLTDRARTVRIRTSMRQGSVSMTIEDSGDGIAPERLPTLFGAFITTKPGGMGLGLSLCQMIMERHNGKLSVASEYGKGTSFEVSLPAERPDAAEGPRIPARSINAEA